MSCVRQQPDSDRFAFFGPGQARAELSFIGLHGVPLVDAGDDLGEIALRAMAASGHELRGGDVVVVAQKIVSKAEGRVVVLDDVTPSPEALALAGKVEKDPRLVELILSESDEVVRYRQGVLIVAHRSGLVLANAGIDSSNVRAPDGRDAVLLLPEDADESAGRLRRRLREQTGLDVAVVISDSVGRAWRMGTVGLAIGVSGLPALVDLRERPDLHGRALRVSETAVADQVASAAALIMGEADEARPIVLARGVPYRRREGSARELIRPAAQDLFR